VGVGVRVDGSLDGGDEVGSQTAGQQQTKGQPDVRQMIIAKCKRVRQTMKTQDRLHCTSSSTAVHMCGCTAAAHSAMALRCAPLPLLVLLQLDCWKTVAIEIRQASICIHLTMLLLLLCKR
jgi:hypothetical protein